MNRLDSAPRLGRCAAAGFTLAETLVAMGITLAVVAALLTQLDRIQGTFQAQQEVGELQQRLRTAVDALAEDLRMAGGGAHVGRRAGSLQGYLAPVLPYRRGFVADDSGIGVFYRPDAISLVYVSALAAHATTRLRLSKQSRVLYLEEEPECQGGAINACGFRSGMRAAIFDVNGAADLVAITAAADGVVEFDRPGGLSAEYEAGATVTQVTMHTYYLSAAQASNPSALRHYDGYKSDLPFVDHVVALRFDYFGEARPPQLLDRPPDATGRPWTTYGPRPPASEWDNPDDSWAAGENCTFTVEDGRHQPRLAMLAGSDVLVPLNPETVVDGPWCPDAEHSNRFDADLLRIRRITVRLRVQVAAEVFRGAAGVLFAQGGTSRSPERYVPDQEIRFDVAPRNLNLGR